VILSISVLAHPSRSKWHPYLREKLGNISFSIDNGCGLIENGKNAWKMYDPNAKFHCVLNDDAIIGQDFYNKASAILEKNGDKLAYSFYMGERKGYKEIVDSAYKSGRGFVLSKKLFFGVAICLPVKYISHMFGFIDRIKDLPLNRNFDTRIHRYVRSVGLRVYYPIPSLVDHRSNNENESLVYDRGADRKAQYFIGEHGEGCGTVLVKPSISHVNPYANEPAETFLSTNKTINRMLSVGDSVVFVDTLGIEHDALITHIHKYGENIEEYLINLVHIVQGSAPQIQYESSIVHKKYQPANGMFWKEK